MSEHDLPTGPMAPLPPPDGALERVLGRFRQRQRHQRAVLAGVAAVVVVVGLLPVALASDHDPPREQVTADDDGPPGTATTAAGGTTSTTTDEDASTTTSTTTTTTDEDASTTTSTTASADTGVGTPGIGHVAVRAVDAQGRPVEGVLVTGGGAGPGGWRTGGDGAVDLVCSGFTSLTPGTPSSERPFPILLSGAGVNDSAGNHRYDTDWAPVVAPQSLADSWGPYCGTNPEPMVVTMQPAGRIEVRVVDSAGRIQFYPEGFVFRVYVELPDLGIPPGPHLGTPRVGDPSAACTEYCFTLEGVIRAPWTGTTILGVPPGTHRVSVVSRTACDYEDRVVTVEAGKTAVVETVASSHSCL